MFVFSTTPEASAQVAPVEYATHTFIFDGSPCPAGTQDVGTIADFGGTFCSPDGFEPITGQADCDASGFSWFDGGSLPPVCAYTRVLLSTIGSSSCPAPTVPKDNVTPGDASEVWCMVRPLVSVAAQARSVVFPVCIESDLVATHAADGQVGTQFSAGGLDYLIHTGPPTCEINCHSGFDFNCDGVLDDYCSPDLDLSMVADVHTCIRDMAAAEEPAAATTDIAAAAAAPMAIPVSAGPIATLAHTGSEADLLAYLGFGLVAFGATAVGVRRRIAG